MAKRTGKNIAVYPPNYPRELDVHVTRTALARRWRRHRDSLSRLLAEGLATAVVEWGGRGKEMSFSLWMAVRFHLAWTCRRRDPCDPAVSEAQWCEACYDVVQDAANTAEHLMIAKHSVFVDCGQERDGCTYELPTPLPCRPIALEEWQ